MTTPLCVYFSSVTENTKAFVEKLGFDSARIPLYPRDEPLLVDRPYLLFVPTHGREARGTSHVPVRDEGHFARRRARERGNLPRVRAI